MLYIQCTLSHSTWDKIRIGVVNVNRVVRKTRIDRKKDVKPTVSTELKDMICRLSYITQTPVKDVCEKIIRYAMNDEGILKVLSPYFVRDMRINQTLYIGSYDNSISRIIGGETNRVSMRITSQDYRELSDLAFTLDVRPARAATILLELGIKDFRFVNNYVKSYVHAPLDGKYKAEYSKILMYTKKPSTI